jgi:hypothetical protein
VTGRRGRAPYNPTHARRWHLVEVALLAAALVSFAIAVTVVVSDAIDEGRWQVTSDSGGMAVLGLIFGALTAVSNAMRLQALDGPGAESDGYWDDDEGGPWDDDVLGFSEPDEDLDDDEVPDDVREDERQHADEDYPHGLPGGAR